MNLSKTFIFEVVFNGESEGLSRNALSVLVEVETPSLVQVTAFEDSLKTPRQLAQELAPEAALQVIQKDLPHGAELPFSVAEIDRLPKQIKNRPPKFQGNQFRAWLL